MKKATLVLAALVLLTSSAFADSGTLFGIRGGLYTDADKPFLGAEFLTGIARGVDFNPNLEYVFTDNMTYMTFNIDAHFDFYERTGSFMYFGGGLAIQYAKIDGYDESDTNTGVNLFVGVGLNKKPVIPYLQAKAVLGDNDEIVIGVGLRF